MQFKPLLAAATLAGLLCALPALAQSAAQHDHAAHASSDSNAASQHAPAQRWATDAPLRKGMRNIRKAVQALDHYQHGHMDATQARNTAQLIDDAVKQMMAQCKLKPEADVALHGLLAKFLAGAKAIRTSKQAPTAELAEMHAALAQYPRQFQDPQWGQPGG